MSMYDKVVDPLVWMGGQPGDYAVEVLKNGGFGTRHLASRKVVPHVLAKGTLAELLEKGGLKQLGQAGAAGMQMGLQVANLGVGLLNLGVSAWTAYKVHKMDKKLDSIASTVGAMDVKLDGMTGLIQSSVGHLDGLIRGNSLMLGFLIEHQQHLGEGLELLRRELAEGVRSVHDALASGEARREALELEQQMRSVFRYYETCSRELEAGREAPRADLRGMVDKAHGLISWLDARLGTTAAGSAERQPLFIARAFALRMEMDARELLDEAALGREDEYAKLRGSIRAEVHALINKVPLIELASRRSAIIEEYVFLHRALRGSTTLVQLQDGQTVPVVPTGLLTWDDGLAEVRAITSSQSSGGPDRLEFETLREHDAWRRLRGLPRGAANDDVKTSDLRTALGMDPSQSRSESDMRQLLCMGPDALAEAELRIKKEVAS